MTGQGLDAIPPEGASLLIEASGRASVSEIPWYDMARFNVTGIAVGRSRKRLFVYVARSSTAARETLARIVEGQAAEFCLVSPEHPRGRGFRRGDVLAAFVRRLEQYVYHGTLDTFMPDIAYGGLPPSSGPGRWSRMTGDPALDDWCIGKIFFASTARGAADYAAEKIDAGFEGRVAVVRVLSTLLDLRPDMYGRSGDLYATVPVPPEAVELKRGPRWVPSSELFQPAGLTM